jgi:DNA-binding MarR family transcriptional regulator
MWCEGATTKELAAHFQRKPSAITSRIKKLELVEKYGE